jgi:hypothetical protein
MRTGAARRGGRGGRRGGNLGTWKPAPRRAPAGSQEIELRGKSDKICQGMAILPGEAALEGKVERQPGELET